MRRPPPPPRREVDDDDAVAADVLLPVDTTVPAEMPLTIWV
jgi:hypothetical protein